MPPIEPDDISLFRDNNRIPVHYWEELITLDPTDVCRRTLISQTSERGFRIPFLNRIYLCRPDQNRIWREDDPEKKLSFQEYLVLLM